MVIIILATVLSGAIIRLEQENQALDKKTKLQFELYRKEVEQQQQENIKNFTDEQQRQREELNKEIDKLKHDLEAKKASQNALASKIVPKAEAVSKTPQNGSVSVSHSDLMAQAGIAQSDWQCAEALVARESGWRVNATNASSGAYGLPQSLPGSKMASAGADWQTNPVTQLRWMAGYVANRYGGWCQANDFQASRGWY